MEDKIIKKIQDNSRADVVYIHPTMDSLGIAKYVSAFANNNGGQIVFGVKDDGNRLQLKNFEFEIKVDEINKYLNQVVEFEKFEYQGHSLSYIDAKKSNVKIYCNNKYYTFEKNMQLCEMKNKNIFISYTHQDGKIVDLIQNNIENAKGVNVRITRDVDALKYKDDITEFMQTISEHDIVISVISDKYLKSTDCMYEISELMRDRKYFDKLFFVILSKNDYKYEYYESTVKPEDVNANIYDRKRFEYLIYWQKEKQELEKMAQEIKQSENRVDISKESEKIAIIMLCISKFIEKLKVSLGVPLIDLVSNDFKIFKDKIIESV